MELKVSMAARDLIRVRKALNMISMVNLVKHIVLLYAIRMIHYAPGIPLRMDVVLLTNAYHQVITLDTTETHVPHSALPYANQVNQNVMEAMM
jgi:hypothetical protein